MTTTASISRSRRGLVAWLDEHLYTGVTGHWDDLCLREHVLAWLRPEHVLLDVGAGAGLHPEMDFRGRAARTCGVDMDPRVESNPFLDDGRIGRGEEIPWPAGSFDVAVASNVLEHLEDPARVFAEVARVLKPGGAFVVKTPNRSHYMPLLARATPFAFHRFVNRLRGRAEVDTFPTRYRANSPAALAALAGRAGLELRTVRLVEKRPEYLRFNGATYLLGWAYERLVNTVPGLGRFRVLLVAVMVKPGHTRS